MNKIKNIFYLFVIAFVSCINDDIPASPDIGLGLDVPTELEVYYATVKFSEDAEENYDALRKLTVNSHTSILSYGRRHNFLYDADASIVNNDSVVLMYSGESRFREEYTSGSNDYMPQTFNTEHVYPQSLLRKSDAVTDLHHLRSTDAGINSSRSNLPFVEGAGTFKRLDNGWYPGDEWKGDVARMILYLNVRYREKIEKVGSIELFLKWNIEDPVSDFEEQRNEVIFGAQGNRNPFIDNPYLATLIWGGEDAENKWE
jgi:endonuclease I